MESEIDKETSNWTKNEKCNIRRKIIKLVVVKGELLKDRNEVILTNFIYIRILFLSYKYYILYKSILFSTKMNELKF